MDHTNDRIEEDVKNILHTRVAIADKLEHLEQRVEEKIEESRMAAKGFARVVEDIVDKTKDTLDPVHQFRQRPWMILGGVIVIGYVAALLEAKTRSSGVYPYYPRKADAADIMPADRSESDQHEAGVYPFYPSHRDRNASSRRPRYAISIPFVRDIVDELMTEMNTVKAGVIDAGKGLIRDIGTQVIPALFRSLSDHMLSGTSQCNRASSWRNTRR